jgi:hypothetical protein
MTTPIESMKADIDAKYGSVEELRLATDDLSELIMDNLARGNINVIGDIAAMTVLMSRLLDKHVHNWREKI